MLCLTVSTRENNWHICTNVLCIYVINVLKCHCSLIQSDHTGDSTHSHRWTSLELVKGTYTTDDSPSDIAEIRLDKVVPLKVNQRSTHRMTCTSFI